MYDLHSYGKCPIKMGVVLKVLKESLGDELPVFAVVLFSMIETFALERKDFLSDWLILDEN